MADSTWFENLTDQVEDFLSDALPEYADWENKNPQRIIAFSGAGGTGKTTLIGELKRFVARAVRPAALKLRADLDASPDARLSAYQHPPVDLLPRHLRFKFVGSYTRSFYAKEGIENEKAIATMPVQDARDFQCKLFMHVLDHTLRDAMSQNALNIVFDRTPIDYFAYLVNTYGDNIDPTTYTRMLSSLFRLMRIYTHVVCLPYPRTWTGTAAATDNFRDSKFLKDLRLRALTVDIYGTFVNWQQMYPGEADGFSISEISDPFDRDAPLPAETGVMLVRRLGLDALCFAVAAIANPPANEDDVLFYDK